MKKSCFLLFLLVFLILIGSLPGFAKDIGTKNPYEAYGLCVVSKVLEYDERFNMDSPVELKSYEKIISFWFGAKTLADANPTNSDAIYDLSRFAPETKKSKYKITHFKDYGFIKKEHRYAYRIMCDAGFIDFKDEFLYPNYRLSYRKLFELLMHFESYARALHGYEVNEGVISDSYSDKNNINITQNTGNGEKKYEFGKMHSFYVQEKESLMPYSYNLKRGTNAKIYIHNGEIIFACLPEKQNALNDKYEVIEAKMFLCNEYDREIIFINSLNSYVVYKYDSETFIFEDKEEKLIGDINITLIDRHSYAIIEKDTRMIKYINVTG